MSLRGSEEYSDALDRAASTDQQQRNLPASETSTTLSIPPSLTSLEVLLKRYYGKRLWIIQELALNHDMTIFLCGNKAFSQDMILQACKFCIDRAEAIDGLLRPQEQELYAHEPNLSLDNSSIWPGASRVDDRIRMISNDVLDTVLDIARKASTTDDRDKIDGSIGLLPVSIRIRMRPDCHLSMDAVSTNFAILLLRFTINNILETILSWSSFKDGASAPSWVPDWTTPIDRYHVYWLRKRHASEDTVSTWHMSPCSKILVCDSVILDCVSSSGVPLESCSSYYGESASNLAVSGDGPELNRYGGMAATSEALLRILTIDHVASINGAQSILDIPWTNRINPSKLCDYQEQLQNLLSLNKLGSCLDNWWWGFDCFRKANASFSVLGYPFSTFFPEAPAYETSTTVRFEGALNLSPDLNVAPNMKRARLSLAGRKLITTKTAWSGLAPSATDIGGVVPVIFGCNFPVILRPAAEGTYQVTGECYVHGIMDGEVVDAAERKEYEVVRIALS